MNEFAGKYRKALKAASRYRDAPRCGWADPNGAKSGGNQTIEIPRKEAVELASDVASALYGSYARLYENLALKNYMDQIAADGMDSAMVCPSCHFRYLSDWMDGKCPYCAASSAAKEKVQEMLEGPKKSRPGNGAAGQG